MGSSHDRGEVVCPECGEWSPADFPVCWSCHAELPPDLPRVAAGVEGPPDEPELAVPAAADRKLVAFELAVVVLLIAWLPSLLAGLERLGSADAYPWSMWNEAWWSVHSRGLGALAIYLTQREQGKGARGWRVRLGLERTRVAPELAWGVVLATLLIVWSFLLFVVVDALGLSTWSTPYPTPEAGSLAWMLVSPLVLVFSAFEEELVFRAYLWRSGIQLTRKPWLTVLICAAFFSSSHVYDPYGSLTTFAMGVIFGASFVIHRKLWRLVVAHWLCNVVLLWT